MAAEVWRELFSNMATGIEGLIAAIRFGETGPEVADLLERTELASEATLDELGSQAWHSRPPPTAEESQTRLAEGFAAAVARGEPELAAGIARVAFNLERLRVV
jgi:hypothetical protein